ncbi:MAG: hypothetical protein KBG30_01655 [Bacteroidales bacterium]|nr:hypothetical protein [Bacteroidales bacterium]
MELTETQKRLYLMLGGTFLPAFIGVITVATIKKDFKITGGMLLFFAGLSALGGYATSKMID